MPRSKNADDWDARTVSAYRAAQDKAEGYLGKRLEDATAEDMAAWWQWLGTAGNRRTLRGLAPASMALNLWGVRAYYRSHGLPDPTATLRPPAVT